MDYAMNGNLKINLKRRVARDRGRLVRAVRYEWSKQEIAKIRLALLASACCNNGEKVR